MSFKISSVNVFLECYLKASHLSKWIKTGHCWKGLNINPSKTNPELFTKRKKLKLLGLPREDITGH